MTSRIGLLQGPDTDPTELGRFRTALARFRPVEGELLHVRKDGSPFWVRLRIMPVPDASGRYTHWVGVAREITARTRRATGVGVGTAAGAPGAAAVRRSSSVVPSTPAPITTPAGHIVHANPVLCALMGRGVEELATASVFDLIHPDDREAVRRACDRLHASATGISEYQVRLRHSEGRVLHTRVSASLALGTAGTPSYRILHIEDVTEPRLLRARLAHQALHDPLTGLPNRALFTDRLTHALARTRREPADLAVLFLNLDRFKAINDAHGHATGDHVLATLARRLPPLLRPADTAARFGGDEFVLLCVGADARHAGDIATRIGAALAEPVPLPQGEVVLTASIGVVTARGGAHPDGLIADADAAMYQAKQSGRARYELCTASLRSRATERLARETALRIGIAHDQLRLHYQPEITLTTGARGRGVLGRRLPPLNGVGPCAPGDRARLRV